MLATNTFSHTGVSGSSPGDRMLAAGYNYFSAGENIVWRGTTGQLDLAYEVGQSHNALFASPGHRVNIMSDRFVEVGLGVRTGGFTDNSGQTFNAGMTTQNFGRSTDGPFLTGVVFDDQNQNRFYTVGEGLGGAVITAEGANGVFQTATWASGGYALELAPGSYNITVSYGGRTREASVSLTDRNVKLDALWADMAAPIPDVVEGAIYRFYNQDTGVHFLTTSSAERDMIINSMPTF